MESDNCWKTIKCFTIFINMDVHVYVEQSSQIPAGISIFRYWVGPISFNLNVADPVQAIWLEPFSFQVSKMSRVLVH